MDHDQLTAGLHVVVQGFPGKSLTHGGLGWSSIVLLRLNEKIVIVDAGGFGIRATLVERLKHLGVDPSMVTDVVLTHAHYDHAVNWVLFPNARVYIGRQELDWAETVIAGRSPVAELYMAKLRLYPQLILLEDGQEVMPGLTAILAPGHTPGHMIYVLSKDAGDVIFTGDSAKNRAELLSMSPDMTMDAEKSRKTIETIWTLWRRKPETFVIPGHDLPMILRNGVPDYIGKREAVIAAWRGENLKEITTYDLTIV